MSATTEIHGLTADTATPEQRTALDAACARLHRQGRLDARHPDWTPDLRYATVEGVVDAIPAYDALADAVAADHGKVPTDGGLDNDPLTQALHDIYSLARHAAGGRD